MEEVRCGAIFLGTLLPVLVIEGKSCTPFRSFTKKTWKAASIIKGNLQIGAPDLAKKAWISASCANLAEGYLTSLGNENGTVCLLISSVFGVNKARKVLNPLIFVPASLPTDVKDHLAGFELCT